MSQESGFAVRRAVDDDLEKLAAKLAARKPFVPAWLQTPEQQAQQTLAAATGRKRDLMRADWGRHVKSTEHTPGGLR